MKHLLFSVTQFALGVLLGYFIGVDRSKSPVPAGYIMDPRTGELHQRAYPPEPSITELVEKYQAAEQRIRAAKVLDWQLKQEAKAKQ